jgi:hypothetical protein
VREELLGSDPRGCDLAAHLPGRSRPGCGRADDHALERDGQKAPSPRGPYALRLRIALSDDLTDNLVSYTVRAVGNAVSVWRALRLPR